MQWRQPERTFDDICALVKSSIADKARKFHHEVSRRYFAEVQSKALGTLGAWMKIAIVGAGGIGGYVGGRLAAAGVDVAFVARGAQLAAFRERGLTIRSQRGDAHLSRVRATDKSEEIGPVDLVVFAVKLWDTEQAAAQLGPLLAENTLVLTLQNGIDSLEMLGRVIPKEQVVPGAMYISSHISEPGVIVAPGGDHRIVMDGRGGDRRVVAFKAACESATALECQTSDDVASVIWQKFMVLVAFSGATALMRRPLGEIRGTAETKAFLMQLIDEVWQVAVAAGHRLPEGARETCYAVLERHPAEAWSSMAEDLRHGRRLELRWLSGRVHDLEIQFGILTPANSAVFCGLLLHEMGGQAW